MAAERNYARLGFFIVVILGVALATALLFIQRFRSRAVIGMVTYTKENVSGLDISSPVRYWGVSVGRVTDVRVIPSRGDPGGTTVEIDFEVFLDRLSTIGANVGGIQRLADIGGVFPYLRSQLVGNPVTGEAYLLLDAPKNPPPPIELGFTPNRLYVPSMPSTISTVQDRLPALLDHAQDTLRTFREIVTKIPGSLDRSDRFFTNVERIMQESQLPALSADSRKFLATTAGQFEQMTSELDGVIGKEGALVKAAEETRTAIKAADLPATSQATREAADNSRLAADDLRRSLPAIRESLEELRELARQLQEQPESVVYGPRPAQAKHK